MRKFFRYIICIVAYKNHYDLIKCLETLHNINDYHVVIVNNFSDDESLEKIRSIALQYKCDFISRENNGYGAGNNAGIEYALNNFDFDYLIISNPDIQIESFLEYDNTNAVYAPVIITKNGKQQNPYWCMQNSVSEYLLYIGMRYNLSFLCMFAWGINKLLREFYLLKTNKSTDRFHAIYACHGAFFIIGRNVLEKIIPIYDENMFLFSEEALLAVKLKKAGIKIFFDKETKVLHSEDGSMLFSRVSVKEEERKSYIYYYENRK